MNEHASTHHIVPLRMYLGIGITLLILTGVTVAVSFIHLGGWNVVVALVIASLKAMLVALFFMHLFFDNKFYALIFSIGVLMLSILIIFTLFDTLNRGDIYEIRANPIRQNATIYQQDTSAAQGSGERQDSVKTSQH